jgi:hypothetical protein
MRPGSSDVPLRTEQSSPESLKGGRHVTVQARCSACTKVKQSRKHIYHSEISMSYRIFLGWPRTRVVEGGPFGAAGLHAALVLDVNHAVRLVLRTEDAALLAREVEVGHARAPRALALAVLHGTCRKIGVRAQNSHAESQTLTQKHFQLLIRTSLNMAIAAHPSRHWQGVYHTLLWAGQHCLAIACMIYSSLAVLRGL